jgi:alkylation response protein AidB-like acyl-CoA dehydrogenase
MSDRSDPVDEVRDWLADNWDPALRVAEWWERLGHAGWAAPLLPAGCYGRGLSRGDALRVAGAIAEHGALGAPAGLGLSLAAPTIATHGTREQVERYVPAIVTGRAAWCQLFSEPGAGSDLAGLATRAVRDGDEWVVNGQKVWTSAGHVADLGMLLARTDPAAPKHQGITWFVLDMHQPGVEVRPLRQMTGTTAFSEVFFTDAVVAGEAHIGDVNDGWAVANTTLAYERAGMGAGGNGPARGRGFARPGSVAGDLDRRAGDFAPSPRPAARRSASEQETGRTSPAGLYIRLARSQGRAAEPAVRQRIVQAHILGELRRLTTERHKAVRAAGGDIPGVANFSKLLMADILRLHRDLGLQLLGPRGTLHGYDSGGRAALAGADVPGGREAFAVTEQALGAQAMPIFGGTDQIQRNILGERVLGLPKEPGDGELSRRPFSELPRNG